MDKMVGIVFGLIIFILVTSFVVAFLELAVPLIVKADFDRTCDVFLDVAVENGGLSNTEVLDLVSTLQSLSPKLSITNTNISRSGTVAYKGIVTFEVNAVYQNSSFVSLLTRQLKSYNMVFGKSFTNKIIIN